MPHRDPDDPPRRRGNKARGHGTWETDRPPVCGVAGRESGHVRLTVVEHSDGATLRKVVRKASWPMATLNTDEWRGYDGLPEIGRLRSAVCHADREWARDDDGDGVREVHVNTLEGLWTGMRNFLRPSRGVGERYLYQYVALFEWGYNVKRATTRFLRALLGVEDATRCPTWAHDRLSDSFESQLNYLIYIVKLFFIKIQVIKFNATERKTLCRAACA